MGAEARRGRPPPARPRSSPTRATSLVGARWKSRARRRWAKDSGCSGGGLGEEGEDALGLALVARARRSAPPRRSRPSAAALLPEGIGWSPISLRRAISSSWSAEVEKKPPRSGSPKRAIVVVGQRAGALEPARLEGRFVEGQQRFEQEGVVLEVGVEAGVAVLVGAQQAAVVVAQRVEDELGAAAGRVEVVLAAEHGAGLGQGGDRQRVPGGQALVVEPRPDPLGARLVEGAGRASASPSGCRRRRRHRPDGGCSRPRSCRASLTP